MIKNALKTRMPRLALCYGRDGSPSGARTAATVMLQSITRLNNYGDGYGDDHGEEEEVHDNNDQLVHLLDVVILNGLLHPAEQIPF